MQCVTRVGGMLACSLMCNVYEGRMVCRRGGWCVGGEDGVYEGRMVCMRGGWCV